MKTKLTVSFLERKRQEYDNLKLEIERLESELGYAENELLNNSGESL